MSGIKWAKAISFLNTKTWWVITTELQRFTKPQNYENLQKFLINTLQNMTIIEGCSRAAWEGSEGHMRPSRPEFDIPDLQYISKKKSFVSIFPKSYLMIFFWVWSPNFKESIVGYVWKVMIKRKKLCETFLHKSTITSLCRLKLGLKIYFVKQFTIKTSKI